MKLLVGVTYYPEDGKSYSGVFFHTRNLYYKTQNIDVTVLNYLAKHDYIIDGIEVITVKTYLKRASEWSMMISHAPDRQAYRFLKKYNGNFKRIVFFIHGNEVLKRRLYYFNQYEYVDNGSCLKTMIQNLRDEIKIIAWKHFYETIAYKSEWVFVSNWMYKEFQRNIMLDEALIKGKSHIIYNCIGNLFEKEQYDFSTNKTYDCITIRGSLDSSKYAIDVVVDVAKQNPDNSFLIIGKGEFFDHYSKPDNITLINDNLSHSEIIHYLSNARIALMPTRHDAQGVMMCEMASFGIPVITSNIEVCHEVLSGFNNVYFIDNDYPIIKINEVKGTIKPVQTKTTRYYKENTCRKEIELINYINDLI